MIFPTLSTSSNPASNTPLSSNVPSEPTGPSVDQFDVEITLEAILQTKINDGVRWNVKELIDLNLLIDAGLATVSATVSSSSLKDSQKSPNPSNLDPNDPSSSPGSENDSDASKSEEDSNDSSLDSLPHSQHHPPPVST
ncbi:hypothetical protein Dimus_028827 [Dionaea muscipula]